MPKLPRGLTYDKTRNQYRIRFRSLHTATGKDYRERLPAGTTRRQAEAHLSRLREDDRAIRLKWPDERRSEQKPKRCLVVEEFISEIYLPYTRERVRKTTLETKKASLLAWSPWLFGLELDEINAAILEHIIQQRRAEGMRASTVNARLTVLKSMLNTAHKLGYRAEPAPKIDKLKKHDSKVSRWLSLEEAEALLSRLQHNKKQFALALFFLHTGGRVSETLALRWNDIDLDEGFVTFRSETTKSGKSRTIPLLPEVVKAIKAMEQISDRPWPYHRQSIKIIFKESPHVLRHTFAAWRLSAGVSIAKVQAWLGHASIQMTVDLYGHIQPQDHREDIGRSPRPKPKKHLKIVN